MEPVRRRLESHDQPSGLADHSPRRNRELVDERRQRMSQLFHARECDLACRLDRAGHIVRVLLDD